MPRVTDSMPSVAMKELILTRVTRRPLMRPTSVPTRIGPTRLVTGQPVAAANMPALTADRPMIEPTERSMPPDRMTSDWPRATMPTTEIWRA